MSETLKLPLWKNALEELIEIADHGMIFPTTWFEERLKCNRDTLVFSLSMSSIRKGLEHYGMELSGHGLKGNQYAILLPQDNARVMQLFNTRAIRNLSRAVILGSSTPLDGLTDSQRREHEKQLSKSAFRLALMRKKTSEIEARTPAINE